MLAVNVDVSAVELLIATDVGERLHVTGLTALEGEVVTAQLRVTVPLKEPDGVTVIVEVLPEVAPGVLTLMAPLFDRVKSDEPAASQNPLQPASSRGAVHTSFIHPFDDFICAPDLSNGFRPAVNLSASLRIDATSLCKGYPEGASGRYPGQSSAETDADEAKVACGRSG